MRARPFSVLTSLSTVLSLLNTAHAQAPAGSPPAPAPAAAAPAPAAAAPAAAAPAPAAAEPAPAAATASLAISSDGSTAAAASTYPDGSEREKELERNRRLQPLSGIDGASGLLRTVSADGGGAGTFRVSLLANYFKGSEFLCPTCAPAGSLPSEGTSTPDAATQLGTRFLLSVTPLEFLEGYAALRYQSTSNNQGDPKTIAIVGDSTLGVKLFTPSRPDNVFTFGGTLDALFLSTPGGVGLDAATVGLRALGTLDLTRRVQHEDRVPLRFHVNAGYYFDGSGTLADDVEKSRGATLGHPTRITRIERFAHEIRRTDTFRTALGAEGVFGLVRPFLEWSLEIPVNRQDHLCGNNVSRSAGDSCLSAEGFSALPSRLTLGARFFPWAAPWLEGASITAALDIGTGATQTFIEESPPQTPWMAYLGIGWAIDTQGRVRDKIVEKIVETPAPVPPERHIVGLVKQAGKSNPVPGAVVRYVGRPLTGMVADEQGKFVTANLEPGEYRFTVSADGYRDGDCSAMVFSAAAAPPAAASGAPAAEGAAPAGTGGTPAAPPATPAARATPAAPPATPAAPGAPSGPATPVDVPVTCELEAVPRTATINGVLRDADTTQFVEGATVTITDPLGRNLSLKTDAEGTFRFGNVPAGKSALLAEAAGYLQGAAEVTLEPQRDANVNLSLHPRPKTPNVALTKTEIKLKKEVHFLHGSAEILPDSLALIEEAADLLRSHPEIVAVEVQGHTDDSGTPEVNQRLSTDRANAVRQALVARGVEASRLSAHGYGQDKPLAPNTSPKNKAKNRRVQLMIQP